MRFLMFHPKFPTLGFVIWAGLLGGSVSVIIRLGNLKTTATDSTLVVQFDKAMTTVYTSALTGAAFAVVLYGIFCAQIVKGPMFPAMMTQSAEAASNVAAEMNPNSVDDLIRQFVWHMEPQASREFALVLCWSFIAGFFERFVPDMLSKIADGQKKQSKSS